MQSPISINEVYASGTWWGERKIKSERQTETDSQTHTDRHRSHEGPGPINLGYNRSR